MMSSSKILHLSEYKDYANKYIEKEMGKLILKNVILFFLTIKICDKM